MLIVECWYWHVVPSQGGWRGSIYVPSAGPHSSGCQVTSYASRVYCTVCLSFCKEVHWLCHIFFWTRATALLLSVSHLVLVTRNACHMSGSLDWIDQSLHAAEDHMVVLREAALASEPERGLPEREQSIWITHKTLAGILHVHTLLWMRL